MNLVRPARATPPRWVCVGVDIGLDGGIASREPGGTWVLQKMPLRVIDHVRSPDVAALRAILEKLIFAWQVIAAVEIPFLLKRQGGALTIGRNWGIVLAAFHSMGIEVRSIEPKPWQKALFDGVVPADPDPKVRALAYTELRHPQLIDQTRRPKSREPHDGVIDAIGLHDWLCLEIGQEVLP